MSDLVVDLTEDIFESSINETSGMWLVDFWAEWCGPCHALTPILDELAQEARDVRVGKLDIQTNPETAKRFDVQSVPTILIFRDGVLISRLYGVKNLRQLKNALTKAAE